MNRTKWASMSDDERRIKIAELCGWTSKGPEYDAVFPLHRAQPGHPQDGGYYAQVPNYLHDLNAMHEAELTLTPQMRGAFRMVLSGTSDPESHGYGERICHANAAQRAEAFACTMEPE